MSDRERLDADHNEYLDTNELLGRNFMRNMRDMGLDPSTIPQDIRERRGIGGSQKVPEDVRTAFADSGTFFMTSRPDREGESREVVNAAGRKIQVTHSPESAHVSGDFLEKTAVLASDAKDRAIAAYRMTASDEQVAREVGAVIRKLERIEQYCGIEEPPFDPLRHKSGLQSVQADLLEHANEVVENTVKNYRLYPITEIKAGLNDDSPVIAVTIVGEEEGNGFVIRATVTARRDFTGSEAIDYVYSESGGLVTVKSCERGRWVDVSDEFDIRMKGKPYKLQDGDLPHSIFVGKKIAGTGEEIIAKKLNLNKDDIKCGEFQVFAKDAETVAAIKELISAN
jgi:hypothetical protein